MPEILEPNRDAKCINCQPEPVIFLETVAAADTETIPQAAQRYARQGWHVFPAPATGEKKSLKSKKFSDGRNWGKTIDETEIQRDWQQWPNANVCIAAGAGSGIWVMEIDTKAGHDVDGAATLAALEATHGALPTTKQAESPSGSIHYYFLWPDDGRVIPNSTSAIGAGIDVRGEGGMVMAPPSIRPGKGVYRWRNSAPVAAPPPWLLELIFAATRSGPHIPGANPEADPVLVNGALAVLPNPDLNRDEWNKMLMAAWRASGGSEETYPAALAWSQKSSKYHNAATTRERWDHYAQSPPTEIGAGTLFRLAWQADPTWRDAYDAALAAKLYNGSGPDYAEPVEAPTAEAGGSGSNDPQPEPSTNSDETATNAPEPEVVATQPPPQPTQPQPEDATAPVDLWDTFAPPALPVGVLPPLIDDWAFEQGALMGADPAGLAMAALTICAAAITDQIKLKPKQHAEWKVTTCLWTGLLGGVSAKKTPIISEASWPIRKLDMEMRRSNNLASAQYDALTKEQKQSTPPPKRPRLVLEDVTIEAAQEVFRDSPDGLLCLRDELGGWFGSMDKYSGHRGASADRAFWLQAYNGGPYSYDRVTRSSGIIENLSACVLGGIQPEPMRKIAEGTVDDGLIQRLCPIMVRPGTAGQDARPAASTPRYAELIKRLHTIREPFDTIIFDDEARALRQTLAEKHQNLMACEAVNRKLGAHIGKFDGIFARLCLLWHCVDHCSTNNWQTELSILVSAATAQRVEQFLHGFLLPHAAAFYFNVFGLSDDHERLTAVAGYILAHRLEVVTNRDVQHGIRMMRKLDRQDVTSVFYQLYALGWLLPPVGPATRDTLRWMVNPTVHRLFEARAAQERARRQQAREILVTLRAR